MRYSRQREAVLSVLRNSTEHPTADMVFSDVQKQIPSISLGTVYRDLRQLLSEGLITVVETSDDKVHYEGNLSEHVHFVCKKCGGITDFFCASPVPDAISKAGLTVLSAKTVYYGICSGCHESESIN